LIRTRGHPLLVSRLWIENVLKISMFELDVVPPELNAVCPDGFCVTMEMKSTSRCKATDMCRLSLMCKVPTLTNVVGKLNVSEELLLVMSCHLNRRYMICHGYKPKAGLHCYQCER
jgi:hypothetical protein